MKKSLNVTTLTITLLTVALVVMSVGFASFAQNIQFNSTTVVKSSNWDISLKEETYQESAGSVTVPTDKRTISSASMTYEITLEKPGDFYEFSIDVENAGTFDAKLDSITLSPLTTEQAKYLSYKFIYGGTEYTATSTGLTQTLNSGQSQTVKVRVEYFQPADSNDLPSSNQTINLNATLHYIQAV